LGYLIQGAWEEIGAMEVELKHRNDTGKETGNLAANLEAMREQLALYESFARRHNLDADAIRKQHGKLNVKSVCEKFGIQRAYLVDYCYESSHVHEKNVATRDFCIEQKGQRAFHFGPIPNACVECVEDILRTLGLVISIASDILEEKDITQSIQKITAGLDEAYTESKAREDRMRKRT
jgi:hypothetical protein